MRNVYIASRYESRFRLRDVVKRLSGLVHVTSRWIYSERDEDPTLEYFKAHGLPRAVEDVEDVMRAEWLVLDLTDGRGRRGGMMFEAGLAHGTGKRVITIGPQDCVFTQLFENFASWGEFITHLENESVTRVM